jgi:hypothetical protein
MAYPVAPGVTTQSGNYIPEIWSGKTQVKFYLTTVLSDITKNDYEGEIKKAGDKVQIRTIPTITVFNYEIGQQLDYERPYQTKVTLNIDKGKGYAFSINDVEEAQSDLDYVELWTDDAGRQLAIEVDKDVLQNVYSDAAAANQGLTAGAITSDYNLGVSGTPLQVTKVNILEVIVDCMSVLDEQNAPQTERYVVLPANLCGLIKKSDLKDASLAGDGTSIMRNGRIGMIDRATIYMSNNLLSTTDGANTVWNCIAGQKEALTFASQLTQNEMLKNPNDFGDLMRGLHVYGYKTIKPEALVYLYAYKG